MAFTTTIIDSTSNTETLLKLFQQSSVVSSRTTQVQHCTCYTCIW